MNLVKNPLTALAGALVGVLALSSTGCGKLSGLVTDVRYQAYSDPQGNAMTQVEFDLDTGALLLPAVTIPILNPNDPSQVYGTVTLSDILGGGTELAIDANLNAILNSNVSLSGCLLPNGKPIPVRMPAGVPCPIGIPLGSSGSLLYLAFTDQIALIGTAVVINEFDGVGKPINGADLFFGFRIPNGITGVAGLFTSLKPSQSGVGVFADLNAVIPRNGKTVGSLSVERRGSGGSSLSFVGDNASGKQLRNAQKALGQLSGKRLTTD